jgi:hypothetical protein
MKLSDTDHPDRLIGPAGYSAVGEDQLLGTYGGRLQTCSVRPAPYASGKGTTTCPLAVPLADLARTTAWTGLRCRSSMWYWWTRDGHE